MSRRFLLITCIAILLASFTLAASSGCKGGDAPFGDPLYISPGDNPYDTPDKFITSIEVIPGGINIAIGGGQQFQAWAVYNDGDAIFITDQVEWFTENPAVGNFDFGDGKFFPTQTGVAVVRCRIPQGGTTLISTAAFVNAFHPNAELPPAVPQNPSSSLTAEGVWLLWDMNISDGDMAGYNIYRTQTYGAHYASDYGRVNQEPKLYPPFLDSTVVSGWYYYRITAVDLTGVQSAPSEEVPEFVTYSSHYGSGFDGGSMASDEFNYKDAFSTAF